jgi:hypothetical protein
MKTQVQQPTAAGVIKPLSRKGVTDLSSSHTLLRSCILALLLVLAALFLFAPSAGAAAIKLESANVSATNANGSPDVQAGSHPYALTTSFTLGLSAPGTDAEEGGLKDVRLELPPGFVGNPTVVPQCSYEEFMAKQCPNDTVIGWALTRTGKQVTLAKTYQWWDPLYNMVPPPGVPAEFVFDVAGTVPVILNASVRTGGDYGITVNVHNISEALYVDSSTVTVWGVPAEASHNPYRGGDCLKEQIVGEEDPTEEPVSMGECPVNTPVRPFLTNPSSCGVPRTGTLSVDSWKEPGDFVSKAITMPELSGCEKLDFSPSIDVTPDGTGGSTPTGLNIDLHVPQESVLNPLGLAEADVKDTTAVLPAGVQISPSAADGQQACSNAQVGFKGVNAESGVDEFTPGAAECPNASKVALVRIKTPLLEEEVTGAVYLAAPQNFAGPLENPFGSLVALYLVAENPVAGVRVKVAGKVVLNPETGQLTSTFENTPEFPFSDLSLEFFGTNRAPLTTPALCGAYPTEVTFAPWSGTPPVTPANSFQITSGPNGSPCRDPLPFSPSLESGTTNINAGAFSDLTTTLSREDGQQSISSVQLHYPAGVSGLLSGVKLCGEQQANEGTCGAESEIGETIVSVGLGNDPYSVTGGKVYITGPYEGAPFGLSIVNPAKAGPFDLQEGRPVVVRAKVEVNPYTAALTITTDPPGSPHAIPTIIEGIPLQIKHVNVLVNRPGFTFNPTNCEPQTITGAIDSAEDASSPVSVPFQVTNCASLKFAPKFAVSTAAKASRADGESLHVELSYPNGASGAFDGPEGDYTNIARVKVELPKQLPSRLTTLQKACTAAQFKANPAGCPVASLVGHAKAITPLIPVPLEGPAYFVSNGNEAFPNLIVVLQGYGVTVDLVGDTFISKAGVTSSTFKTVPDAPVGSFELTLPEGSYSALTTDGNLCKTKKLVMPTEFVAQNGAELRQSTEITVTGCPKGKESSKRKTHEKGAHNKPKRRKARPR